MLLRLILMEAKNEKTGFEFSMIDYRRVELQYRAQFTLKEGNRGLEECTLINVNKNLKGIGIRFHTSKEIKINSIIIIDLLTTGELGPVCITGILRWIRQAENDFIGGIELIGNTNKLKRLLP
jgi:hypothetical protein